MGVGGSGGVATCSEMKGLKESRAWKSGPLHWGGEGKGEPRQNGPRGKRSTGFDKVGSSEGGEASENVGGARELGNCI